MGRIRDGAYSEEVHEASATDQERILYTWKYWRHLFISLVLTIVYG